MRKNTTWHTTIEKMTQEQRDNCTDGEKALIFNTDTNNFEAYNGNQWVSITQDIFEEDRNEEGDVISIMPSFPIKPVRKLVESVEHRSDLDSINLLYDGRMMYVKDWDITYECKDDEWKQCGENCILREGLSSGFLNVIQVKAG